MHPIKVKLTHDEAWRIVQYCMGAGAEEFAPSPNYSLEVIILAEFKDKIATQYFKNRLSDPNKAFRYTIPVSVACILHHRWQKVAYCNERQMVLKAIDYELTNRNLKPYLSKPVIV